MKGFLNSQRQLLFLGTFLAITLLVVPATAAEITQPEKLRKAEELSIKASEIAVKAKETGNVEIAKKALELASETSVLLSGIASMVKETGNAELARTALEVANTTSTIVSGIAEIAIGTRNVELGQAVMKARNDVGIAIRKVLNSVQYLAQTSTDPSTAYAVPSGAIHGPAEAYEPPEDE